MFVIKRDGSKETVKLEKISKRIQRQAKDLKNIDPITISKKVVSGLYDGVSTKELDKLAVETAYFLSTNHPEYDKLATRLVISSLHKDTPSTFTEAMELANSITAPDGSKKQLIATNVMAFIRKNASVLNNAIDYSRDFSFDFFGFKTLERSYLLKGATVVDGKTITSIIERPQHMWMRVACGIHYDDVEAAINTYNLLSTKQATHATPTLFNAGLVKNQLSSCFLVANKEDSIHGIFDTLKECALISQSAGGIGVHIHDIRSKDSIIYGSMGTSKGTIPFIKIYNELAKAVDQGGNKRKASLAFYIEPWHADVEDFIELRKNNGKEDFRARDINLALWTPDLFFKRLEADEMWSLMDPSVCKGLSDVYGDEFEKLYIKYESEGKFVKQIKTRELWSKVLQAQIEGGEPYILAKDAANKKSNQKNLGTIKSSNLCCEIMEVSTPDETAVCNLASISLPSCVETKAGKKVFNFDKLQEITRTLVQNLNKVIDIEYYPVPEAEKSNRNHRPIGIGIQGLADVFIQLRMSWESQEARDLNKKIAEAMYFAGVDESANLAQKQGSYSSFEGSPASQGILQFDMWGVTPTTDFDWNGLKEKVKKGLRNSLIFAPMPTASTSQILGNTECFEPITTNLYKRSTLSGSFYQVNKYLVEDLIKLNLWNDDMKKKIIAHQGSIQSIPEIPSELKTIYKTVWEISQKILIDMSADRGAFTCQSQSLNIYFKDANFAKLTSAYFYAWKAGLKTIVYYTRSQAAREAIQFTVDKEIENSVNNENDEGISCSLDNPEACEMCSG